ncbi:hypothetical protein AGMMS49982_07540 [Bacteroidia bacterium]|nr:hypothetical protein AGMMS49982_07540 [Bacteroidia bacterium]
MVSSTVNNVFNSFPFYNNNNIGADNFCDKFYKKKFYNVTKGKYNSKQPKEISIKSLLTITVWTIIGVPYIFDLMCLWILFVSWESYSRTIEDYYLVMLLLIPFVPLVIYLIWRKQKKNKEVNAIEQPEAEVKEVYPAHKSEPEEIVHKIKKMHFYI